MTNSLLSEEKVFGGTIKAGFEFVKNCFHFDKNPKEKALILGGEFTQEKLYFLFNSLSYFSSVKLFGKIGLLFCLWKLKSASRILENSHVLFFKKLAKFADELNKPISYPDEVFVYNCETETEFEALKTRADYYGFHENDNVTKVKLNSVLGLNLTNLNNMEVIRNNDQQKKQDENVENEEKEQKMFLLDFSYPSNRRFAHDFKRFESIIL